MRAKTPVQLALLGMVACVGLGCPTVPQPTVILVTVESAPREGCDALPSAALLGAGGRGGAEATEDPQVSALRTFLKGALDFLQGDRFGRRLAGVQDLTPRVTKYGMDPTDGPAVLGELRCGQLKGGDRGVLPLRIHLGRRGVAVASTRIAPPSAEIAISRLVAERMTSNVREERACAVNTLIHEMTHAIPDADGNSKYQDWGFKRARSPLVSYAVGSVAQCAYLEQLYGVDLSEGTFTACVTAVGTTRFDGNTCNEGWFEEFVTP